MLTVRSGGAARPLEGRDRGLAQRLASVPVQRRRTLDHAIETLGRRRRRAARPLRAAALRLSAYQLPSSTASALRGRERVRRARPAGRARAAVAFTDAVLDVSRTDRPLLDAFPTARRPRRARRLVPDLDRRRGGAIFGGRRAAHARRTSGATCGELVQVSRRHPTPPFQHLARRPDRCGSPRGRQDLAAGAASRLSGSPIRSRRRSVCSTSARAGGRRRYSRRGSTAVRSTAARGA